MSLLDATWNTWLAATREADEMKVGDHVRNKLDQRRVGTLEEIDRTVLFSHFVHWDGVQGLWPCYRFDLERITEEAGSEPKTL